jgi:hypothetical protein
MPLDNGAPTDAGKPDPTACPHFWGLSGASVGFEKRRLHTCTMLFDLCTAEMYGYYRCLIHSLIPMVAMCCWKRVKSGLDVPVVSFLDMPFYLVDTNLHQLQWVTNRRPKLENCSSLPQSLQPSITDPFMCFIPSVHNNSLYLVHGALIKPCSYI